MTFPSSWNLAQLNAKVEVKVKTLGKYESDMKRIPVTESGPVGYKKIPRYCSRTQAHRTNWGESPREMHQDKGRTICGMRFNLRVASATFTPASDGTLFKGEPVTLWWFLPSHLRLQILQKVKIGIFLTFFMNKIYAYDQICRIDITNKCVCDFTENIRFLYHPTTHF